MGFAAHVLGVLFAVGMGQQGGLGEGGGGRMAVLGDSEGVKPTDDVVKRAGRGYVNGFDEARLEEVLESSEDEDEEGGAPLYEISVGGEVVLGVSTDGGRKRVTEWELEPNWGEELD